MKLIALHDAEMDHFGRADKFPNYALMKISAHHKGKGDAVEWFSPLAAGLYDIVYSSKVFEWTPENPYLPPNTIKGGMGYGILDELPSEIDNLFPDYSIYPSCDYAIGFITRGCVNNCRWCGVPKKEGYIHPYRRWQEIVRSDTKKLTLLDNNILSCNYGIEQLEELSHTDYKLDLNQGIDARLVTPEIAKILSSCKWQKYLRFSCDTQGQIDAIYNTAELLMSQGIKASKIFIYCLITKNKEDDLKRIYAMRKLGNASLYGMPEKNPSLGIMPDKWQMIMANKYIYSGQWRKIDWDEWAEGHKYYF